MNDEFYIGWEAKAAPGTRRKIRQVIVMLSLLAVLASVGLAICQRLIGQSVFEWGTHKTFSGILETQPYPHLLVARPGKAGASPKWSIYYLVAPWKFGLDREALAALSGKPVTVKGTLIYRGNQTMVETKPEWIQANEEELRGSEKSRPRSDTPYRFGRRTLLGEIVDSKCFLGVMNPGQLTPHRACAIRCISGGIPPVLLVRQKSGPAIYLLLVSAEGKAVNEKVLEWVAEPVEITGEVEREGDQLILRADPATYRRANRMF